MAYGRVIKNSTYHSRKRVPMRRRRTCKTNYRKRQIMIRQNLQKCNFQQTRLVVRITNRQVICQMVKAYPIGDVTLVSASSQELPNYKFNIGLKNFTACYLTGLLLGCRAMRQSRLHKIYRGNSNPQELGIAYLERNLVNQPATYRAILDMGLKCPSKGSKIFAALKGVTDAGVFVPYKPRLFYGFNKKDDKLDSEALRDRIRGVHLAQYASKILQNKDDQNTKSNEDVKNHHFSQYFKDPAIYPLLVDQTIENIRKNPKRMKRQRVVPSSANCQTKKPMKKVMKMKKKPYEQRLEDIKEQKNVWMQSIGMKE